MDIIGKSPRVLQDRHFILNARVLIFIGQKKIEAMRVEAGEEGAGAVLADLQQNRRYEDANGTKTRHGV